MVCRAGRDALRPVRASPRAIPLRILRLPLAQSPLSPLPRMRQIRSRRERRLTGGTVASNRRPKRHPPSYSDRSAQANRRKAQSTAHLPPVRLILSGLTFDPETNSIINQSLLFIAVVLGKIQKPGRFASRSVHSTPGDHEGKPRTPCGESESSRTCVPSTTRWER